MQINPVGKLNGTVTVPGDKSISHRSIMFGALAKGTTHISGFLNGADCLSTAQIFKHMGVQMHFENPTTLTLEGLGLHGLKAPDTILDVGNSGTTMRLLSGILAGQTFSSTLTGDASIQTRPMNRIIEPLKSMGANIASKANNGLAPLIIQPSQLHGITYHSKVASAQVKSCILLATLYADQASTIIEPSLSRNHSELMLKSLGADIHTQNTQVTIKPNPYLEATSIDIPGDISSAAYFLVAGLILPDSDIILKNVGINPTRDGIIKVLKQMNGSIEYLSEQTLNEERRADIRVRSSQLIGTTISGDIIPTLIDEIPAIAVAACFAEGQTHIKDAQELKVKESNRIDTMVTELKKMGANIEATEDGMIIEGTKQLSGAELESYHDHRIAMSLTIAALAASTPSKLNASQCIDISYPSFFEDINLLV